MPGEPQKIKKQVGLIHSQKIDYADKIKELKSITSGGFKPPIFLSDNDKLNWSLRELGLNTVLVKNREYKTIIKGLATAYDEFNDFRAVLLGIPPLRWGRQIESFNPFGDIDEDGYIEMVVASLPQRIGVITDHVIKAALAHQDSHDPRIAVVSQDTKGQVIERLTKASMAPDVFHQIADISQVKDYGLVMQISDGVDRIHGTPDNWVDSWGTVLAGKRLKSSVEQGFRFAGYPLVFSEACRCGRYNGILSAGFVRSLAVYLANSMVTTNNAMAGKWYELLCGDGFKFGLLAGTIGKNSVYAVYREVVNRLIGHARVEDKRTLDSLLTNQNKLMADSALQVLTFNLYGLDRPSPLYRAGKN